MIATLRTIWRGGWLALHVGSAFPLVMLCYRRPRHDSRLQRRLFRWWLKGVCRIVGVQVVLQGSPRDDSLVAANHVSWLDIPVLASVWHGAFLAKAEVADWPVIGHLVRRSGTLLIRRGSLPSFRRAAIALGEQLWRGGGVCIFPEGTTTDGRQVGRFQPRLFEAAAVADAWVQPVALRYFGPDGQLHPHAPFIDDDAFLPHLLRLLRGPAIRVEVVFLPRLSAHGHAARSLSEFTRWQICTAMEARLGVDAAPVVADDELLTEPRFAV